MRCLRTGSFRRKEVRTVGVRVLYIAKAANRSPPGGKTLTLSRSASEEDYRVGGGEGETSDRPIGREKPGGKRGMGENKKKKNKLYYISPDLYTAVKVPRIPRLTPDAD